MRESRTLEDIHRDVDFSNRYRLEYIKHLMSLSAGIFVISVAFMKDVIGEPTVVVFKLGLITGWGFLILSLVGGILHMKCWDRYYISYRKDEDIGNIRRKHINMWRIAFETCQIAFFLLGITMIFCFVALNLVK